VVLRRGVERGELSRDLDIRLTNEMIWDSFVANYRHAIFENWDASALEARLSAQIKILLAGITLPPNYGSDYIHQFEQVFQNTAAKHHAAFVPMIYKDLIHVPGTIQQDGIHPTAKGSEILANTLLAGLKPILRKSRN